MTPALLRPLILVVFLVIHNSKNVNDTRQVFRGVCVEHSTDHPISIVTHIKYDAVSHLIRGVESLPQFRKVVPGSVEHDFVPARWGYSGILGTLWVFPEHTERFLGNDPQRGHLPIIGPVGTLK